MKKTEHEDLRFVREGKRKAKKKCLYHPALQCPTPEEPCIFTKKK